MFKSSISEQFYSGDGSFAADANSTIDQFSTPLKKLPTSSIYNLRNELHSQDHSHNPSIPEESGGLKPEMSLESLRLQLYKLVSDISPAGLAQSVGHGQSLQPLNESSLNQLDTIPSKGLFSQNNGSESKANGAVFYKPLSIEGPMLPQSMIPPPLKQTARNPFIVSEEAPGVSNANDFEDLDDDDELFSLSAPTGEWTSPVVIQALRRQVNKERIFKGVWRNILLFAFFHLSLLFIAYFYQLYRLRFYDENSVYRNDAWSQFERLEFFVHVSELVVKASQFAHHFQWFFVLKVVWGVVQLVRPQDQCTDLPLTNKQRELIGLKPVTSASDDDESQAELVIKERMFESAQHVPIKVPKYRQLNDLPGYMHRGPKPEQGEDAAIALANLLPPTRLIHSAPQRFGGLANQDK